MNKGMVTAGILLLSFFLIIALFYTAANIKNMQAQNEILILRNDSLHIEQLKIKKELAITRQLLDSMQKKNFYATP